MTYARKIALLAGFALASVTAAGTVEAETLKPAHALSVSLGDASGVAYYTAEAQGYHVVVTLMSTASSQPVRFESVLSPNQSVTLSAPQAVGDPAQILTISRLGDGVVIAPDRRAAILN